MKSKRFSLTAVFILAVCIAAYLVWDYLREESELSVVTLCAGSGDAGEEYWFSNLTRSWINFNALACPGDTVALPVAEGDLIYFTNANEGASAYVRYDKSMGSHLAFTLDTLSPVVYLNHQPYMLIVSEESKKLDGLSDRELEQMEAICIDGNGMAGEMVSLLENIASVNPEVGLAFEGGDKAKFYGIAGLFRPKWMILPGSFLDTIDGGLMHNLRDLELLYLTEGDAMNYDALGKMPDLESLMVTEMDAEKMGEVSFDKLARLSSLTVIDSELHSLAGLQLPSGLKDLFLISLPRLTDAGGLKDLPGLRDLGLMGCDSLTDLSVLSGLPPLRWLSLPPGVTRENFNGIIAHQKDLQGLELVGCDRISDLSSLVQLKNLESLALSLPEIDFESLKQLPAIRLVVIDEKHFTGSEEEIAGLREALPDACIVPGGGYCLGSGWLLLLLPFLVTAVLVRMNLGK